MRGQWEGSSNVKLAELRGLRQGCGGRATYAIWWKRRERIASLSALGTPTIRRVKPVNIGLVCQFRCSRGSIKQGGWRDMEEQGTADLWSRECDREDGRRRTGDDREEIYLG